MPRIEARVAMMFVVTLLVSRLVPMVLIASGVLVAGRFAYDRYCDWSRKAASAIFAAVLILGAVGLYPLVSRAVSIVAAEWNFGRQHWERSEDWYARYERLGGSLTRQLNANRARALLNAGRWLSAERALLDGIADEETSAGVQTTPETIYLLGIARFYGGRLEPAQKAFESLPMVVDFFLAPYFLGRIADRSNDPSAAVAHYRRGIELEPDFFGCHYHLVRLLLEQGDREAAAAAVAAFPAAFLDGPQAPHALQLQAALADPTLHLPEIEFQIVQIAS